MGLESRLLSACPQRIRCPSATSWGGLRRPSWNAAPRLLPPLTEPGASFRRSSETVSTTSVPWMQTRLTEGLSTPVSS